MTNQNGDPVQHYGYTAFGNERYKHNTQAFSVTSRYTGQQIDEDTGLYFYQSRYYDPQLGRFIQADTIIPSADTSQSLNRYSYVKNNPLKFTDPSGHGWFSKIWKSVKKFVGAIVMVALIISNPWFAAGWGLFAASAISSGVSALVNGGTWKSFAVGVGIGFAAGCIADAVGGALTGISKFGEYAANVGLEHWTDIALYGAIAGAASGAISSAVYGGKTWEAMGEGAATGAVTSLATSWAKQVAKGKAAKGEDTRPHSDKLMEACIMDIKDASMPAYELEPSWAILGSKFELRAGESYTLGDWIWNLGGAAYEGAVDGSKMFANGATFGLLPNEWINKQGLVGEYGQGMVRFSEICGGTFTVAAGGAGLAKAAGINPWLGKIAFHSAHAGGPHQYTHLQIMIRTAAKGKPWTWRIP